jgi:hypothetical protein
MFFKTLPQTVKFNNVSLAEGATVQKQIKTEMFNSASGYYTVNSINGDLY